MREILFRGKRIDNGEWVEGCLAAYDLICPNYPEDTSNATGDYYGQTPYVGFVEVDQETVGQFTGLTDENGKKIFEGDIVHVMGNQDVDDWKNVNYNALIAFLDSGFCAIDGTIEEHAFRRYALARMEFDLEIIGNIHDNPELLEAPNA